MRREIFIAIVAAVVSGLVIEGINWSISTAKAKYWDHYSHGVAATVDTLHGKENYWQNLAKYRGDLANSLAQRLKALNAPAPVEAK